MPRTTGEILGEKLENLRLFLLENGGDEKIINEHVGTSVVVVSAHMAPALNALSDEQAAAKLLEKVGLEPGDNPACTAKVIRYMSCFRALLAA